MQARAHRTRNAVVAAAAREFSRKGFAATTTKSIAEEARVATGSVYQYFADKSAILLELAEGRLGRIATDSVAVLEAPHEEFSAAEVRRRFRALSELLHKAPLESKHGRPYTFEPGADRWSVCEI